MSWSWSSWSQSRNTSHTGTVRKIAGHFQMALMESLWSTEWSPGAQKTLYLSFSQTAWDGSIQLSGCELLSASLTTITTSVWIKATTNTTLQVLISWSLPIYSELFMRLFEQRCPDIHVSISGKRQGAPFLALGNDSITPHHQVPSAVQLTSKCYRATTWSEVGHSNTPHCSYNLHSS